MEKFMLVIPTLEYKDKALDYIKEHQEYNSNINGVGGLHRFIDDYEGWLEKLANDRIVVMNKEKVPGETYFLVRVNDDKIIGMVNIRLELNEKLRQYGGHIGYGIRPTERRKGYNKINLFLALLECQKRNIKDVMLDCDKENLGSAKTIQYFNPTLEREYYDETLEEVVQTYWINVDEAIKTRIENLSDNIK